MKLLENGDVIRVANLTGTPDRLAPGNYLLKVDTGGYYLQRKEDFVLPKKIYGDHHEIDRWLKSYRENSDKNLGVILSGMKGTGKTITCQKLCVESKMPVIIINEPYAGSDFIDFITAPVFEDSIVFVDEYEKIYQKYQDGRNPHDFLQIMDGNYATRLLFLLTVNEMEINSYLINRPGRVKYRKAFDNLPQDVLDEVIDDLLVNKDHKESVYRFFERLGMVTFDLVVSLIRDMNLFNQDAMQCGQYFNLKSEPTQYTVTEVRDGKSFQCQDVTFNLGMEDIYFQRLTWFQGSPEKEYEDAEEDEIYVDFKTATVKKTSLENITIQTPEKHTFKLVRKPRYYYAF